jgi:hypothetical protein
VNGSKKSRSGDRQWRTRSGTAQTALHGELNSILNSEIAAWIPNGISEPQVRLLGNDRFSLRVIVDIDEFKRRRKRPQSAGPLNFLSGKMPALVRGNLITGDGKGQFKLQSTEVNGIPLPPALALELLSTHTKTRRRPDGFDIQKPFDLPAKFASYKSIRRLVVISNRVIGTAQFPRTNFRNQRCCGLY